MQKNNNASRPILETGLTNIPAYRNAVKTPEAKNINWINRNTGKTYPLFIQNDIFSVGIETFSTCNIFTSL